MSVFSDYFKTLESEHPDVASRYTKKIEVINNLDPFTLDENHLITNLSDLPPVTMMDIVVYLVRTTSFYTNEQMKAFKSLDSFKFYEEGVITDCGSLRIGDFFIVIGKVKHSQRVNLPVLRAWIICEVDGSVRTAHCTCMTGQGEVCSHVGALLFAVENVVTSTKNRSCTDIKAPSTDTIEFKKLKEMEISRVFNYENTSNAPPMSPDEIVQFLTDIEEAGSSSVLMTITEPFLSRLVQERENNRLELLNHEDYES